MPSATLDTRARYRRSGDLKSVGSPVMSRTIRGSTGLAIFHRLVRNLVGSPRREREHARQMVTAFLTTLRQPVRGVNHLVFECVSAGGTDGLDMAIDVLSRAGGITFQAARDFLLRDHGQWRKEDAARSVSDDIWYVLLRSVCRSKVDKIDKVALVLTAVVKGTIGVREAAVQALGDMVSVDPGTVGLVRKLLEQVVEEDASSDVRDTARGVLRDLEG